MSDFWKIAAVAAIAGVGGTGLGGTLAAVFRKESQRTISLLLSFAAGVMVSIVCFDLLTNAVAPEGGAPHVMPAIVGTLAGYIAISALNWLIRHGRVARRGVARPPLFWAGLVMAAAIALHNMPEGMVIGASFAAVTRGGLLTAAVIGAHNIPEGMAVAVPLISGGMSRFRAVAVTAGSGLPTVLGAMLGYCLGTMSPAMLTLSLSFASGAMLYVVFGELLPEALDLWHSRAPAFAAVLGMLLGMLLIYA